MPAKAVVAGADDRGGSDLRRDRRARIIVVLGGR